MSTVDPHGRPFIERIVLRFLENIEAIAWMAAPPVLRVALALPFFRSGLTRWDGFPTLSVATLYLFENQFKLHVFGGAYDFPAPDLAAFVTATAEICLPILLVLGLGTRFAAFGLLIMTGVIQLVFPEGWKNFHLYWASLAVAIIAIGPGLISLDRVIGLWLGRTMREVSDRVDPSLQ